MKDPKQMISVRIEECDRIAVQSLANRLFVRDADIYRFAISQLFIRFGCLIDENCSGSDLLLALVQIRDELHYTLGLKKHHLEKIINSAGCPPEKYVAKTDLELLLMPQYTLKQHLLRLHPIPKDKLNIEQWLKEYLSAKYVLQE